MKIALPKLEGSTWVGVVLFLVFFGAAVWTYPILAVLPLLIVVAVSSFLTIFNKRDAKEQQEFLRATRTEPPRHDMPR
jgi:hypothetical protein